MQDNNFREKTDFCKKKKKLLSFRKCPQQQPIKSLCSPAIGNWGKGITILNIADRPVSSSVTVEPLNPL